MSHLSRMGLEVTEGASPLVLRLSGPVKTVQKAFGVRINVYTGKANVGYIIRADFFVATWNRLTGRGSPRVDCVSGLDCVFSYEVYV